MVPFLSRFTSSLLSFSHSLALPVFLFGWSGFFVFMIFWPFFVCYFVVVVVFILLFFFFLSYLLPAFFFGNVILIWHPIKQNKIKNKFISVFMPFLWIFYHSLTNTHTWALTDFTLLLILAVTKGNINVSWWQCFAAFKICSFKKELKNTSWRSFTLTSLLAGNTKGFSYSGFHHHYFQIRCFVFDD